MEMESKNPDSFQTDTSAFWVAGVSWLALTLLVCGLVSDSASAAWVAGVWSLGLWAVCLLDLYALVRAVRAVFGLASATAENRAAISIQALYWGVLKLACMGLLLAVLFKAPSTAPRLGILLGVGTLAFVPLVGGFFWSQRALRHA